MQSFPGSTEVPSQPKSAPTMKHPGAPATPKQIGAIQAIIRAKAFNEDEGYSFASATLGRGIESFKNLSMGEASTLIGVLKAIDNPVLPEPAF